MKYTITGGKGVVASLFARRLISEGHSVTIIDDGSDPRHEANSFDGPTYLHQRLEQMPTRVLADVLADSDRVFHAAASTGIPYSATNPLDDWRRNVDGTLALLEALRVEPRPMVVLSSVKPYELGDYLSNLCLFVGESFPLRADEPYAASKAAQSLICQAYARSFDLPILVFRCSNLYGPACPHGARHGWMTNFAIRAALNWPIEIQGDGHQSRDMLHASDVATAALAAYEHQPWGEILNLGGGGSNVISVLGAYSTLLELGSKSEATTGPTRKNDDPRFETDTREARSQLGGWSPEVNVKTGLREVYNWACANREMLARVYEGER
ncbi:MAG TPA: NAD-dependent epimerase/dehydratase family protein [Polyangiaceae bacterium]